MLKQLAKSIRKQLLKVDWIRREVEAYKQEQQKQRDDALFAKCMIASGAIRESREPRVVKRYIDSAQWGRL